MATNKARDAAVAFFHEHADYGHDPATETAEQGRARGARALARAEAWLVEQAGYTVEWEQDRDYDPDDYDAPDMPPIGWACTVAVGEAARASLCGITFDGDHEPWGNPYARVVVAELALELMPE